MLSNSLKQIFRGLWRYKSFTIINLLGLSIGIAAVLLIFMIADYEKGFDHFDSNGKNIFRVVTRSNNAGKENHEATVPYPTAKLLRNEYPGVQATEVHYSKDVNIRIGNQSPFAEKNILFADSLFFNVFDFANINNFRITGDPVRALSEPRKAILTQSAARRYFGNTNPIGKLIKLDNKVEVEVAAIVKDIPPATHLPFNIMVSFSSFTKEFVGGMDITSWNVVSSGYCYVRIENNSNVSGVEKALYSIVEKNGSADKNKRATMYLQPLQKIHFDPAFDTTNPGYTVSPKYLMMLLLLGGFIILIACINYINLSTSLAFSKSKEVGIRKTIGATKTQLFFHYISETIFLTIISSVMGLVIAILFLPVINNLLDKSISAEQLLNFGFIAGAIMVLLIVSFISGVYPALVLSGFNPIESLKNQIAMPGKSSTIFRKVLIIFQFTTSIALIICTIIIAGQMHYFNSKSLGFNKDAVVQVDLPLPDSTKVEAFRSLLQNQAGIQNISFCLGAPISENGINTNIKAPELSDKINYDVKIIACDNNYLKTYGIKLLAGRWFFAGEEKNLGSALVINEALVKILGYKNPSDAIGKKITIGINNFTPPIIGVVQDFHTTSLREGISPIALMPFPYFYYAAGIRIDRGNVKNTLASIESAYNKVYPEYVYHLSFIDETLAKLYEDETRNYNLFKAFSAISIFICCIGLWGLITFVLVRKTKEIGIRKVLGATVTNIVALLSRDFLKLVLIALIVASPVAWYFMHQWLQNFAYRINIGWWVFALAGLFAITIALLTISFQAIKAATANPVKSLRTE